MRNVVDIRFREPGFYVLAVHRSGKETVIGPRSTRSRANIIEGGWRMDKNIVMTKIIKIGKEVK